ncbi:chemotaxis protein [Microvirga thermotolerans]|uniref:Chemotaxis protein MotC n=1 Tax=Microvirga thermotolerans TaxID=2651334 RepID=A0A5P9JZ02_9HYPH|nr:chemotaxis protein [Microvirga thermotolerans]QFU17673.1 chemotaxis protein MotC [Microvirga thermotolerans]
MARRLRLTLALSGCLLALPADGIAQQRSGTDEGNLSPVHLVRTLQTLQDQIASGSTNAHVAQRVLLTRLDEKLTTMDDSVWQSPRNVQAAVVYVLSGGKPDILRRILAAGHLGAADDVLVRGSLAYVEGREEEAQKLLGGVNPRELPITLSGQVALVQAALNVRDDPAKSVELLDYARLQLPGTLVEEAALRREILVLSQTGDTKKFDLLSRQYLRRFRYSVYAGNFRQRFAAALTRLEFTKDPDYFSRLVAVLSELEPAGQLELYLLVARAAVIQGQTKAAILAANKAYELAAQDKVSAVRATLYRAAAMIVTSQGFDEAARQLRSIDRSVLETADVGLLDSALAMAKFIRESPTEASSAKAITPAAVPEANTAAPLQRPTPTISRAQEVLGQIDKIVRRESR